MPISMRFMIDGEVSSVEEIRTALQSLIGALSVQAGTPPAKPASESAVGAVPLTVVAAKVEATVAAPADAPANDPPKSEFLTVSLDPPAATEEKKRGRGRPPKSEQPQISTGEPREEVAAAPEVNGAAAPRFSLDDIRNALGAYVSAYGMPAVQQDGPIILSRLFGDGKVKLSDIPDNQESLGKALVAIQNATAKNEFKRPLATS